MKVGIIVYHPQFRREGQYTGTGIVREVEETGSWDNVNVLVQWDDGVRSGTRKRNLHLKRRTKNEGQIYQINLPF